MDPRAAITIDAARPLDATARKEIRARSALALRLEGYGLVTAEMLYGLPDAPHVLNTFIFQDWDRAPDFSRLFDFIAFWHAEIEGPLHSVRFTHHGGVAPTDWRSSVGTWSV